VWALTWSRLASKDFGKIALAFSLLLGPFAMLAAGLLLLLIALTWRCWLCGSQQLTAPFGA
jgi:hypothetical protein